MRKAVIVIYLCILSVCLLGCGNEKQNMNTDKINKEYSNVGQTGNVLKGTEDNDITKGFIYDFTDDVKEGLIYGSKDGEIVDKNGNIIEQYSYITVLEDGSLSDGENILEGYYSGAGGKILFRDKGELETTKDTTEQENKFRAEPKDSPLVQVCELYMKNTYVEWNDEVLLQICDNTKNLVKDNYTYLNKYIEDIKDINCYVGYETKAGKSLVFVTYNIKFANVSTCAPAMETLIIVKAQEGNGYLIHNYEVGDDDMDLYISNMQNNQNYLDLCSSINAQLSAAIESDADLKKICGILSGAEGW